MQEAYGGVVLGSTPVRCMGSSGRRWASMKIQQRPQSIQWGNRIDQVRMRAELLYLCI